MILFISCKNEVKEYYYHYPNGELKMSISFDENMKLEGIAKQYYDNGAIKSIQSYKNGKNIDSSIFYRKDSKIYLILYYKKEDTLVCKAFKNNRLHDEGEYYKNRRIGYWYTYNQKRQKVKRREFIDLNGKEYLNQEWDLDNKNNIIDNRGNNYLVSLNKKDYSPQEIIKIKIHYNPIFGRDSRAVVYMSPELKSDYSNLKQVRLDERYSLDNDFDILVRFSSKGSKNLRGYIQESLFLKNKPKDEQYSMREVYFNIPIVIK